MNCGDCGDACTGQDGTVSGSGRHFNVGQANGQLYVTDSDTGLVWTKTVKDMVTFQEAQGYCDDLNYAGFADWRLPTATELLTIVNWQGKDPAAFAEFDMPTNGNAEFWSGSPAGPGSRATVDFSSGALTMKSESGTLNARCVRGAVWGKTGYFSQRFVPKTATSGEVYYIDSATNLAWYEKVLTTGCPAWRETLSTCDGFNFDGLRWRSPNINELMSLFDLDSPGFSDFPAQSAQPNRWFSSTTDVTSTDRAWQVEFDKGNGIFLFGSATKQDTVHCTILCVAGPL